MKTRPADGRDLLGQQVRRSPPRTGPGRSAIRPSGILDRRRCGMLNGTWYSRGRSGRRKRRIDHRQRLEDEAPDDAEGVRLAQQQHVAAADDDGRRAAGRGSGTGCGRSCRTCGCGFWNQSGRTPSSATRLSTPLEPMIAVFTAPDRIRQPTTTTKALSSSFGPVGPDDVHRQAADQVVGVLRHAHVVGDEHHRQEGDRRRSGPG